MKYLFLFIRIFADKALQIKLNIKRNWKFFKKEFRKEPILHKKSRVFRRNFVKYTRLYRLLTAEKRLIELEFIKKSHAHFRLAIQYDPRAVRRKISPGTGISAQR